MPSWKKVITSGSDAVLNSVIATGSLDTINRELIYNDQTVLDWDLHQLAANGVTSVEWDDRKLFDSSAVDSIDWSTRQLFNHQGNASIDYDYSQLIDTQGTNSVNWDGRQLINSSSNVVLDWYHNNITASANIYMSASTQLYGTASYALTASRSDASTVSVSSSITYHPVQTTYGLVFTNNSQGSNPLHISPYGPQYDATANSISSIGSVTASNGFFGTASYARQSLSSSYAATASVIDVVDFGSPLGPYTVVYKVPLVRNSGSGQTLYVDSDLSYNGNNNILFTTSSHSENAINAISAQTSSKVSIITADQGYGMGAPYYIVLSQGTGSQQLYNDYSLAYSTNTDTLQVTASNAQQSLSSSYALTASYVAGVSTPTLQQVTTQGNTTTNNVIISASLIVSNSIDSNIRNLYDTATTRSISWADRQLFNETGTIANVDYLNRQLRTMADEVSVDWQAYELKNSNADVTVDWNDWKLYANAGIWTLDWVSGLLRDTSGTGSADWDLRVLTDNNGGNGITSIDWGARTLYDASGTPVLYWSGSSQLILSASNLYVKGIITGSTSNVLTYDTSTGQIYYTASNAIGAAAVIPTLQQVTDQGNDTTAYITASGFAMFDGAAEDYVTIQPTDGGIQVINNINSTSVLNVQTDVLSFGQSTRYVSFQNGDLTSDHEYRLPNQNGTILVTPWTGSAIFSGSFYLQGLTTTSSVSNVLTFNPTTGQVYYTASSAIGGGSSGPETDPIFTAWSGSTTSQFAGTSSFALTASLAPNYVLNTATSSFVLNSQTSSMTVLSSSFALTASFVQTALTSSFVTASNVYGPFGSNSIQSASYAVTASYISNINAAGNDTEIQFNSNGILYATSSLTYLYASQSINHGNNKVTGIYSRVSGLRVTASSDYSQAEGFNTWVNGNYSHAEGSGSRTAAEAAHAEGVNTLAKKIGSHAEGLGTLANAPYQLTIGRYNSDIEANGDGAFIIGNGTSAATRNNFFEVVPDLNYMSSSGDFYNKEDVYFPGLPATGSLPFVGIRPSDGRLYRIGKVILGTGGVAIGSDAISGGKDTQAIGDQGFSIGDATIANGTNAVSTGKDTSAVGSGSLTTGDTTTAVGDNSVATGKDTVAVGTSSLATGKGTVASGSNAIATGRDTIASGSNSMTAGSGSKADAENSVAFGKGTIAKTEEQVVIGRYNTADTQSLFVVGAGTSEANRKTIMKVDTVGARIDGSMTISGSSTFTNIGPAVFSGSIVQAENTATGINALGFGLYNTATGDYSVTHGKNNTVLGYGAAAFGESNFASGDHVLIHGASSKATADYSFASGLSVSSSGQYQHVTGKYNIPSTTQAAFIIGNGTNNTSRSNLLVASGDVVQITGSLLVSNSIDSNNKYLIDNNGIASVRWNNYRLYNSNNNLVVHWGTGDLYSGSFTTSSISWTNRLLRNSAGITKVDWENNYLTDPTAIISMDWNNRTLYDGSGANSIGWNARILSTPGGASAFTYDTDYLSNSEVYHKENYRNDVESEALSDTLLEHSGQAIRFAGQIHGSCVVGGLVYLDSGPVWRAVDQTTNVSTRMLGIYLDSEYVLLEGDVVIDGIQGPDYGSTVYIRNTTTSGDMSTTIPTAGYVRVVGHCYHNNTTTTDNWILKFRPSNDWYEI